MSAPGGELDDAAMAQIVGGAGAGAKDLQTLGVNVNMADAMREAMAQMKTAKSPADAAKLEDLMKQLDTMTDESLKRLVASNDRSSAMLDLLVATIQNRASAGTKPFRP